MFQILLHGTHKILSILIYVNFPFSKKFCSFQILFFNPKVKKILKLNLEKYFLQNLFLTKIIFQILFQIGISGNQVIEYFISLVSLKVYKTQEISRQDKLPCFCLRTAGTLISVPDLETMYQAFSIKTFSLWV